MLSTIKRVALILLILLLVVAVGGGIAVGAFAIAQFNSQATVEYWKRPQTLSRTPTRPLIEFVNGELVITHVPSKHYERIVPSKFVGVADKTVTVGDKVSWRDGVSAVNPYSGVIPVFSVDISAVNLDKAGTYQATYTATDRSGNTFSAVSTVTVKKKKAKAVTVSSTPTPEPTPAIDVTPEYVNALADDIIASLALDGKTAEEKLLAINKWVKANAAYVSDKPNLEVYLTAYDVLKTRRADCFGYYALSEILLKRAGFETIRVERDHKIKHYWNLVNVDGLWYHFDTTPFKTDKGATHMFTASRAAEMTGTGYRYKYDPSLYPVDIAP